MDSPDDTLSEYQEPVTKYNKPYPRALQWWAFALQNPERDALERQILTQHSLLGKAPFLLVPGGERKVELRGGGLTPPAFPACPASGPRESPPVKSQVLAY